MPYYTELVYPRVCGGAVSSQTSDRSTSGLSPRVRGSRRRHRRGLAGIRSIPACAGEPIATGRSIPAGRVYPRVCGGAQRSGVWYYSVGGLSPRVRGSPWPDTAAEWNTRSIPAGAGEPERRRRRCYQRQVYPRGCGGAKCLCDSCLPQFGLSPRVRGSHHHRHSQDAN